MLFLIRKISGLVVDFGVKRMDGEEEKSTGKLKERRSYPMNNAMQVKLPNETTLRPDFKASPKNAYICVD